MTNALNRDWLLVIERRGNTMCGTDLSQASVD